MSKNYALKLRRLFYVINNQKFSARVHHKFKIFATQIFNECIVIILRAWILENIY